MCCPRPEIPTPHGDVNGLFWPIQPVHSGPPAIVILQPDDGKKHDYSQILQKAPLFFLYNIPKQYTDARISSGRPG